MNPAHRLHIGETNWSDQMRDDFAKLQTYLAAMGTESEADPWIDNLAFASNFANNVGHKNASSSTDLWDVTCATQRDMQKDDVDPKNVRSRSNTWHVTDPEVFATHLPRNSTWNLPASNDTQAGYDVYHTLTQLDSQLHFTDSLHSNDNQLHFTDQLHFNDVSGSHSRNTTRETELTQSTLSHSDDEQFKKRIRIPTPRRRETNAMASRRSRARKRQEWESMKKDLDAYKVLLHFMKRLIF
jgi:hypothetical protein